MHDGDQSHSVASHFTDAMNYRLSSTVTCIIGLGYACSQHYRLFIFNYRSIPRPCYDYNCTAVTLLYRLSVICLTRNQ